MPASGTELEGELEPVLERLDDVDAEASEIEAQATAEAERRREEAARKAEAILAEARVAAEAERARAAGELRTAAEHDAAAEREGAAREVERIEAVREERLAQLVGEVVACVLHSGH